QTKDARASAARASADLERGGGGHAGQRSPGCLAQLRVRSARAADGRDVAEDRVARVVGRRRLWLRLSRRLERVGAGQIGDSGAHRAPVAGRYLAEDPWRVALGTLA